MKKIHGKVHDVFLKKQYGQHFLRDTQIVRHMIDAVSIEKASIIEIGPGDGFLTKAILQESVERLWAFEIDADWVAYLQNTFKDERLRLFHENILDEDFSHFGQYKPWTVLANLPYQITFPILHLFYKHRSLLKEGVIMVQEEVAQKIVKKSGRGYGYVSLFFQYYFDWRLMDKIGPQAFYPPPKVDSRLLYFAPKLKVALIEQEELFWSFIKVCFRQPRRTLRNNLAQTHYPIDRLSKEQLEKRAQQLSIQDLLVIWHKMIAP